MSVSLPDDPPEPAPQPTEELPDDPTAPPLDVLVVCPFLAGGDGTWRGSQPTRSHVCSAVLPPAVLTSAKQRQLCLTAAHVGCATYSAAEALLRAPAAGPFDADLWPSGRPLVLTMDPVRSGLAGGLTSPQAKAGGQALLVGLIVVAFVVMVIARTSSPSSTLQEPSPGASMAAVTASSPSPADPSTPEPVSTGGSPAASAPPSASATADPGPATRRTYKVKRGDTLSSIALAFGVTVRALRKANGLSIGDVIRRGQVLIIPAAKPAAPTP